MPIKKKAAVPFIPIRKRPMSIVIDSDTYLKIESIAKSNKRAEAALVRLMIESAIESGREIW